MSEDLYALLGATPTASDAEIERVYRRLARAYHPDLLRDATSEERDRAEERLKAINRAHHILGDRERRAMYDRERRAHAATRLDTASPAHPVTPDGARTARAGMPRPVTARTTHQAVGGPLDIEWTSPPPVIARPATDLFTVGRLLRYALLIILFALVLGLVWHPRAASPAVPTPSTGGTTVVRRGGGLNFPP